MQTSGVGDSGAVLGNYSDSAGKQQLYGALLDQQYKADADANRLAQSRKRVNCVPLLLGLLVPWFVFLSAYGAMSFFGHYAAPMTTWFFVLLALLASAGYLVSQIRSRKPRQERFYPLYFGVSCAFAVLAGTWLGMMNFWQWMHPVYEVEHLATYNNVDPSTETTLFGEVIPTRGGRFQDAGVIYFTHNVVLDTTRSMSFKMGDLYCVAPIINPQCNVSCGMDFWAVGVNCCSETAADFRCGEYNNPLAKSGIRVVAASQRPLFRLAVLQALGEHRIDSTSHPVFVHWLQDPLHTLRVWQRSGFKNFIALMFLSFGGNAVNLWLYMTFAGHGQFGIPLRIK